MKNYLALFSLGLGLFLTGCQSETISEDMTDSTAVVTQSKEITTNKIHTPEWLIAIHTPEWLKAAFEDCDNFPAYNGTSSLNVKPNDTLDFGKEVMLESLIVGGNLSICGRLGVANKTVIKRAGKATVAGMMSVGDEDEPKDLMINYGGHLNVRGYLVVTGDLILNNGASLHFVDDTNSEVHNTLIVLGEIKEAEYSFLTGEYEFSNDLHDLEGEEDHDH